MEQEEPSSVVHSLTESKASHRLVVAFEQARLVESVGSKLHIKFNPEKSQLLLFNLDKHREVSSVYLSGGFVSQITKTIQLGHLISLDNKLPPNLSTKDLMRHTNILALRFGHSSLKFWYVVWFLSYLDKHHCEYCACQPILPRKSGKFNKKETHFTWSYVMTNYMYGKRMTLKINIMILVDTIISFVL
ncbi:hypothetical protein CAPTEDRAFT_194067 [Capitella teleta]|uniref:Uncharacterized protein n=1 Tax=Capitella teleta TaxID=283909 RepID=R7V8W7_CAPTE|nr:hypothetical protein CAPTEDRAFT_194067 [Capitella teleta]|eukprot:ELU12801.1 hypothetical protein CAPTEDRAFT_194067 [Capitella teleta]